GDCIKARHSKGNYFWSLWERLRAARSLATGERGQSSAHAWPRVSPRLATMDGGSYGHPEATLRPSGSQPVGTLKPPSGYPEATPRLPRGYLEAPLRLPRGYPEAPLRLHSGSDFLIPRKLTSCRTILWGWFVVGVGGFE